LKQLTIFRATVIFICLLAESYQVILAQNDRHYNTIHYGLRGIIMNGSMVAGVKDNSAIYYNPAALSISKDEGLDASLFAISLDLYNKKNAFGGGNNAKNLDYKIIPGLVTFVKRPFKDKDIKVGAGLFTRQSFDNTLSAKIITEEDFSIRVNEMRYSHKAKDFWLALAVAYKFENNVSIGLSQYLTFRSDNYAHDLSYQVFDKARVGKLDFMESERLVFNQSHTMGMLNKIGMTWNNNNLKFGMTLTTPTYVHILRSASVNYQRSLLQSDSLFYSTISFKNRGKYKTPLSATAGIEFNVKWILIAAAVEYFHSIKEYDLVNSSGEDLIPLVNGTNEFVLKDSRKRVFNINLGWEIPLNEKLFYLGGFRTNFNYNDQPSDYLQPRLHMSYFDIYHITNGIKMQYGPSRFTVGLDYAFSYNSGLPQLADLNAMAIPSTNERNASISYNNLTFLITYSFIMDKFKKMAKENGM
jgi:hypothetical protein